MGLMLFSVGAGGALIAGGAEVVVVVVVGVLVGAWFSRPPQAVTTRSTTATIATARDFRAEAIVQSCLL